RSSAPLSQCSPKGVQPMPTIATRSLMPLLAMAVSSLGGIARLASPMPPAASEAAAVERHHLEGRRLDTFQAPDVHGRRRRTRFVAADGERRAAACRAEVMSDLVAPEGVAGEIGLRGGEAQLVARAHPEQVAALAADRAVALDGLGEVALDLEGD